jgi:hypothetical protein
MSSTLEQIQSLAEQLSADDQTHVLEIMERLVHKKSLESDLPPGTSASALLGVHFSMSYEEAESMKRAIMEDRERSIYDD